ncbi:hypothetical protein LINGRAHAP2_LOCUS30234, partial [Linum grandiflorum]
MLFQRHPAQSTWSTQGHEIIRPGMVVGTEESEPSPLGDGPELESHRLGMPFAGGGEGHVENLLGSEGHNRHGTVAFVLSISYGECEA